MFFCYLSSRFGNVYRGVWTEVSHKMNACYICFQSSSLHCTVLITAAGSLAMLAYFMNHIMCMSVVCLYWEVVV